ncbi:unknown [Firmicutes bacterium CAG:884]|nr:unknown [Firmicutes bacterium CAG:884]
MRESINTAIIVGIIITIVGLIELVLFASFAYSRAFKVKGRIVDMIEEKVDFSSGITDSFISEVDSEIGKIGYKINQMGVNNCPNLNEDEYSEKYKFVNSSSNYNYCIYQTKEKSDKGEGYYYTVISYMYFDTPLISFKIPIKGQTKTMYNYEGR